MHFKDFSLRTIRLSNYKVLKFNLKNRNIIIFEKSNILINIKNKNKN